MPEETMPKLEIRLRSALEGKQQILRTGVTIEALSGGHVIQVLARADAGDLAGHLAERAPEPSPCAVRPVSPGQWFLVLDRTYSRSDLTALLSGLGPDAVAVDQSHGRVRIRLKGPRVDQLLAKGTAVDTAIDTFPTGHATATLFGHIGIHLARTGADTFEILVLRGFAESLWDELAVMSLEFA